MPYLLAQAGELTRLRATILNVLVFQIFMKTEDGRFQLIKAWRMVSFIINPLIMFRVMSRLVSNGDHMAWSCQG